MTRSRERAMARAMAMGSGSRDALQPVADLLAAEYGDFSHHNKRNPLHELLFVVCSLQTNETNYQSTYLSLRRAFPRADMLATAKPGEIARAIAHGGLAKQKARHLRAIAERLMSEFGRVTLSPLRARADSYCETFLTSLPGVGLKTARCVMLYSLHRAVFPVDTHCWRIGRRLGLVRRTRPDGSCSARDMDRLQAKVPKDLRYSLHVNMVSHGRAVCTAASPRCHDCLIRPFCRQVGVGSALARGR